MPSYDPSLFNVDPYYDDFNEDKKFLRLMFRPGYGVQARELTQLQTLLQNQVERLGSHIFEEGSIVLDGQISENRLKYARISTSSTSSPSDFIGVVMGRPNRASARIIHVESPHNSAADNYPVLFFEYMEGGTGFTFGDIIAGTASNGAGITAAITGPSVFTNPVGDAIVVSVDRGVRFIEGYFVLNTAQSIAAHSIIGNGANEVRVFDNPTTKVGFDVVKDFVTASEDSSLNDPAFGYYNYAAPGSDRFVIDMQLTQYGYTASDTSAVDNFSRVGFIEFMRIVDGDIVKVEKYPDYAMLEDTLARRTFDESGNYTVIPFDLALKGPTTANNTAVLKAELSPGKAYVFGYEFETQSIAKLNIECARGDSHLRQVTRDFVRYVGPTTKVRFSGIPDSIGATTDFGKHPSAFLSSGESGAAYNQIGTARLRGVEVYQGLDFDLGLYDIVMSGTASFSDVRRVYIGQTAAHAFVLTGNAGLEDESQSSLLYRIPEGAGVTAFTRGDFAIVSHNKELVANPLPPEATTYTFSITESLPNLNVFPSFGSVPISTSSDIIVFDNDGTVYGGTAARGEPNELSITINAAPAGKILHIISTREPADDDDSMKTGANGFVRTKQMVTENISLTGHWASLTGNGRGSTAANTLYLNGLVDVVEILSLTGAKGASSGISVLSYFNFDNGQRDAFYDWSRMALIDGATGVSGPYSATIRRYARTGNQGFFTVASYMEYGSYESIPSYTSKTTGEVYALRDCIDFRPDRSLNGDIQTRTFIPTNTAANDNQYEYIHYLPRTDKIVLTRDRQFAVIRGTPSLEAEIPPDDPNAMSLYTIRVNPYTINSDDASIRLIENKRYTMRDIGALEKRIEAVEYYTTLNLLEQDAKAKSIRDENGDEMPKRGILVDQFKGHAVADSSDIMFSASVDEDNNEVRPAIDTRSYDMQLVSVSSVTGNAEDAVYTLNYTESPEIINVLASGWQTINPFAVINYMGTMALSPSTDKWFDDKETPKVKVNVGGENDNFKKRKSDVLIICPGCPDNAEYARRRREEYRRKTWGASYNSWESRWFGSPDQNKKNTRPNVERTKPISAKATGLNISGINSSNTPESIRSRIQNKTVKKDIVPRARQKEIAIKAKGLKPNTPFKIYCDDMDVSDFCAGPQGAKTDFRGEVSGLTFYFNSPIGNPLYTGPEQEFLIGRHTIRIMDGATVETSSMAAEAIYTAEGAINPLDTGLLSTRQAVIRRKSVKSEKVVTNLSEVLTSSGEIRGYADPLSQTFYVDPAKYPSGVFLKSVDLYFKGAEPLSSVPVMVQIRPTQSGYPHPSKILPFATSMRYGNEIYVPTNPVISSGEANKTNFPFSSPVYLLPGEEYAICISTNSPNYSVFTGQIGGTILKELEQDPDISITKQPLVRALFKPQNTGKIVKSENESLTFRLNFCNFVSSGSIRVQNSEMTDETANLYVNEFRLNTGEITPEGTVISYSGSIGGTPIAMQPNKNGRVPADVIQISNSLPAGSVASITAELTNGAGGYVSPVFDLERCSLLTVSNVINNKSNTDKSNTNLYNGELEPTNSGVVENNRAASRYISKRVSLEEGLEAENITVIMSLCNPKGSSSIIPSIKVFVRPVPLGEQNMESTGYIELPGGDGASSPSEEDFREVSYTNLGNNIVLPKFKTFSIKVCMFGDPSGASFPRIRNLRIIAT